MTVRKMRKMRKMMTRGKKGEERRGTHNCIGLGDAHSAAALCGVVYHNDQF
jgi:hypothetical protein